MEYNMADKEMKNVTPEPSENTENSQEKELIDMAVSCDCDAVKFQKRDI